VRRLIAFVTALFLVGVIVASASSLGVEGGVLQVFRIEVEVPTTMAPPELPVTSSVSTPAGYEEPSEPSTSPASP
jgi:hypothetical protein